MRKFLTILALATAAHYPCGSIDPANCQAPHVDEAPFEGSNVTHLQINPIAQEQFTATAVVGSSCTICGKVP